MLAALVARQHRDMSDAASTSPAPSRDQPSYLLRAHAIIVVVPLVIFAVLWALDPPGSGEGANIGAGIAGLPLIALGLPWSAIGMAAFDASGPTRSFAHDGLLIAIYLASGLAGAPLNVILHALLYRRLRHRHGRAAPW